MIFFIDPALLRRYRGHEASVTGCFGLSTIVPGQESAALCIICVLELQPTTFATFFLKIGGNHEL
jgi:hypothetical protein